MFQQIIGKIGRALDYAKIPYMIIGGQAVLFYGIVRLTKDIDITLGVDIDHLPQLATIAGKLNLRIIPKDYPIFVARTMVLPVADQKSGIRVDFVFSSLPYEQEAIKRAKRIKLGKVTIKFASLEDIIIHKILAGRPKDIEDVRNLLIKHPKFNAPYIRKWLKEFSVASETRQNFLQIFHSITGNKASNRTQKDDCRLVDYKLQQCRF